MNIKHEGDGGIIHCFLCSSIQESQSSHNGAHHHHYHAHYCVAVGTFHIIIMLFHTMCKTKSKIETLSMEMIANANRTWPKLKPSRQHLGLVTLLMD